MGLFGGAPKVQQPRPTPVTPRLADSELAARDKAQETRKRQGIEDQILSLGRVGTGNDRQARTTSLLGRTAV